MSNGLGLRSVYTVWDLTCIGGKASLVSVKFFDNEDTKEGELLTGFTTSFRNAQQPRFLRLQTRPNAHMIAEDNLYDWLAPSPQHELNVNSSDIIHGVPTDLRLELERLRALHENADQIQEEINALESKVMSHRHHEFEGCPDMMCILRNVVHKVPLLGQLLKSYHHHGRRPMQASMHEESTSTNSLPVDPTLQHDSHDTTLPPPPPPFSDSFDTAPDHGPPDMPVHPDHPPNPSPPWTHFPGFRPPHPWSHPPFAPGRHPLHTHGRPAFRPVGLTPKQRVTVSLLICVGAVIISVAATALILRCLRCKWFGDARRRVDCAARREERHRRHLYHKAACRYKWSTFVKRFRRKVAKIECDEKQGLFSEKVENDGNVMYDEISNLRNAHHLVDGMMKAEEGHAGFESIQASASRRAHGVAELDSRDRGSVRSETLPAYSLPPPEYGYGQDGDISVIDGFTGYTPSMTEDTPSITDDTTESSVVNCSPRLSFETQRTTITRSSRD